MCVRIAAVFLKLLTRNNSMDEVQIHFVIGSFRTSKVFLRFTYIIGEKRSELRIYASDQENQKLDPVEARLGEKGYESFRRFIQSKGKDIDSERSKGYDFSYYNFGIDDSSYGAIRIKEGRKTGVSFNLDFSTHGKIESYIEEIEKIREKLKQFENLKNLSAIVHSILPQLPKWEPEGVY